MIRWDNKTKCAECGAEVQQYFLSTPKLLCADCVRKYPEWGRWGCLLAVPTASFAAIICGILGYQIGKLMMMAIPNPVLPSVIGFIAGVDAAAAVTLYLGRTTGFLASDFKSAGARISALAFFALLGAKCARGMGIEALLWITILNVIVMLPVVFWLMPPMGKESESARRD